MALKKRRAFEVFTLSFLDCICCGFGAVVLFYTIVQSQAGAVEIQRIDQLTGEVKKLEEEVLVGEKNLVVLRNTVEKTDEDAATAKMRAQRIAEEMKKREEQTSTDDNDSIARREHINQLIADIKSMEEGKKRLEGGALDKGPAGSHIKSFRGRGDRRYISALRIKGKRIMVLLDTSASMMDDDVVKIIRLRNQPEAARKLAPKWRRALDMVEWISAQLPPNSQFQVYGFNVKARAILTDTQGKWLDSNDPKVINNVLTAARNIVPGDGTSLVNAFITLRTINPNPDQVILITDGLPTQGSVPPARKFINVRERETLFNDAMKTVTRDQPMDIVLLPMKGDLLAAHAFWRLARKTGGSYVVPSRDWP
ncbi:MAG TPA: VWA domain-containing protein [Steroidobacteraceae bacterium]|jgi:outer membrane murein-binding lipoprotein Lpp|nr:VWA domain-containing protein [Steroidobacteraceae bacterium]